MSIFTEFKFSKSIEENLLRTVHCFERHLICESRSRISHTFVTINKILADSCGVPGLNTSNNVLYEHSKMTQISEIEKAFIH